jgi:hypothetical protein
VQAECLALRREIGDPFGIALSSNALADATLAVGDGEGATTLYRQAIDICRELRYDGGIAASLEGLACAAAAEGSGERAAALFAAAEKLRDALHTPLPPVRAQRHEHFLDLARARVGEAAWAAAWTRGRALSVDGMVDAVRKHEELVSAASIAEDPGAHPPRKGTQGAGQADGDLRRAQNPI